MERFLRDNPDSKYVQTMKDSLLEVQYQETQKKNTTLAMKNFVDKYPDSKYTDEIKALLFDALYQEIQANKSYIGYKDFLIRFPNSKYENELQKELYDLHLAHVKNIDDASKYQEFLAQYPKSDAYEEIECLIACKENKLNVYEGFIEKYPKSTYRDKIEYRIIQIDPSIEQYESFIQKFPNSDYSEAAKQQINNLVFTQYFPEVLASLNSDQYSDKELTKKIDKLCLTPPTKISYKEFTQFQKALSTIQARLEGNENVEDLERSRFLYAFSEFSYYVSNAIGRNSMVIMVESATDRGGILQIDLFKLVESAEASLNLQLAGLLTDKNPESRKRALTGLDQITSHNTLELSKRWTEGQEIRGMNIMMEGIPIRLDTIKETLKTLSENETDATNKRLIKQIQTRLNKI